MAYETSEWWMLIVQWNAFIHFNFCPPFYLTNRNSFKFILLLLSMSFLQSLYRSQVDIVQTSTVHRLLPATIHYNIFIFFFVLWKVKHSSGNPFGLGNLNFFQKKYREIVIHLHKYNKNRKRLAQKKKFGIKKKGTDTSKTLNVVLENELKSTFLEMFVRSNCVKLYGKKFICHVVGSANAAVQMFTTQQLSVASTKNSKYLIVISRGCLSILNFESLVL